jgi:hypothetical protein
MWFNINNKNVYEFHYEIRKDFKNVALPADITDDALAGVSVFPLFNTDTPVASSDIKVMVKDTIILNVNNDYEQTWTEVDMFADTTVDGVAHTKAEQETAFLQGLEDTAFESLRTQRNQLLAETDWTANSDVTMTADMTTYRQALRDLPANTLDINNPVYPIANAPTS